MGVARHFFFISYMVQNPTGLQTYAAIAQPAPVVNGNSAFIVTEQGLVVVDSQSWPSAARSAYEQLRREVVQLPVRYVINTHHHLDHAHGNAAYAQLFGPRFDIVSTTLEEKMAFVFGEFHVSIGTRGGFAASALEQAGFWFRSFLQRQPVPATQLRGVPNQERYYAFLQSYIGGLRDGIPAREARLPQLSAGDRTTEQRQLEFLRTYFLEMSAFAPALPDITFDKSVTLHCGDITIEVRYLGRGHTAGDAVAFVPDDRVVCTGDLVHGLEPLLMEAFPDEWPGTLDRLAGLDFEVLVPGHGPLQQGRTILNLFKDYLTELNLLVREGVHAGKSLSTLQAELVPKRFRSLQNQDFGQTLQRNRESLLGLPPGQPLDPIVSAGVEQVYYYYTAKQ